RTYADVHSSGLTSRIVKYHKESGGVLQRSMSFNNLHQPITQPRKSSITSSSYNHKPNLPPLSMTQIAPPEHSFYCGNTLPSLLRSNSLMGVEKCSEQLSRENRPILHPQLLHHENEPTRSVLEELKEISRKRINSGVSQRLIGSSSSGLIKNKYFQDIQQNEFNTKKSCNRIADFVDHHNMHPHPHSQQMSALQSPAAVKRHRELSVAVPLRLHHAPIIVPQQHQHQQQQQQHHQLQQQQQINMTYGANNNHSPQQSPEQVAKRRNCSYSNDISSSLSSSKLHSNKRKLYDMREKVRLEIDNATSVTRESSTSPDNSPRQNAAKIQRRHPKSDLRLEHLTKSQSTPITPLPATPAQRTVSEPTLQQLPITQEEVAVSPRPKLTLFNAQQQQLKQRERTLDLESPDADVDAGEYAGIHFVKPKQQNTFNGVKNSNLERTQKTKLALMLSSLRGEIYQDEPERRLDDETDAKLQLIVTATSTATLSVASVTTTAPAPATAVTLSLVTTTAAAATTPASTTKPVILNMTAPTSNNIPELISLKKTATTNLIVPANHSEATTNLTSNTNGPVPNGLKLPTSTAITFASPKAAETMPSNEAALKMLIAETALPLTTTTTSAGLFPFDNTTITTTTTITNALKTKVATTAAITAPTITFGNIATAAASVATPELTTVTAVTTATGVPATSSMFAFGSITAAKPTTLAAPITTKKPTTFSFGNATSNNAVPAFKMDSWSSTPLESAARSSQSLSNAFKATIPAAGKAVPTTAHSTTNSSKVFSFGNSTTNTMTHNAAAPVAPTAMPIFSQSAAIAPPSAPLFNFNTATTLATTASLPPSTVSNNSSGIFTFAAGGVGGAAGGAPAVVKPVAKATPFALPSNNKMNVFSLGGGSGGVPPKTPAIPAAPSSFNFNAASTAPSAANTNNFSFNATPKKTPIFGSSAAETTTAGKPFTFGGNVAITEQQPQSTAPAAASGGGPQPQHAGGFSFAAVAQKSETTNLFGTPAVTGVVKPSFNFGGNTAPSMVAAQAPAAFGGFATPATPGTKPFTFGPPTTSPPAGNVTSPMGGNLFTSAATQQRQQQHKSSDFFSPTNNSNGGQSAAPALANVNAPFAFGGATSPPQMNTMSKPFTFGGSSSATPSSNMFGSPAPASSQPGAFNFSSTASPVPGNAVTSDMQGGATAQQLNSGNVFALPNTPESRPMRRATRRLQK
ncbi:hypothetical protein KR044_012913, partial [Drosophila immigrans]